MPRAAPAHPAFYCVFPTDAFQFPVRSGERPRAVEGVLVTIEPESPTEDRSREMTLLVSAGRPKHADETERWAVHSFALQPDKPIADVCSEVDDLEVVGGGVYDADQAMTLRRTVMGFLLYLMTQHPNVEGVPRRERRDLSRIRSAAKRRKAEQRELRETAFRYVYVRPPPRAIPLLRETLAQIREGTSVAVRRVCQHWVQTHFRRVHYGPGRVAAKVRLIFDFVRGSGPRRRGVQMIRVQTAQERQSSDEGTTSEPLGTG